MLARIAHDLYWLGRHLVRAEHTARMLDGLFHADLQGRVDDPSSVTLSWDSLLVIMGAGRRRPLGAPRRRRAPAHHRRRQPGLDPLLRRRGARGRAHAARHDLDRDVGVGQHLPPRARAARPCTRGLRTGPSDDLQPRARALRPVLGPDRRARCRRTRRARSSSPAAASRPPTWSCECCAWRCRRCPRPTARDREVPRRDGNALALLRAVGGMQAFMRSAAAPPDAGPVAHFLLYEREFPDSVASLGGVAAAARWSGSSSTRTTRRRCCACGGCSPTSTFRAQRSTPARQRGHAGAAAGPARARAPRRRDPRALLPPQHGRAAGRERVRFSISYRTEYRYGGPVTDQHNVLRVRPSVTPTQRVGRFRMTVEPGARLRAYTDYFGTEVVEFNVAAEHDRLADRGRVRGRDERARRRRRDGGWEAARERPPTPTPAASSCCRPATSRRAAASRRPRRQLDAARPAGAAARASARSINGTLRVPPGRDVRRLDRRRPARRRRRRLPGLRPPRADPAARARASPPATSPATCSPTAARATTRPRSTRTPGSRRCCPAGRRRAAPGSAPTRRTARSPASRYVKIGHGRHYGDVPPIRGVYRGAAPGSEHDVTVRMTRLEAAA